MDIRQAMDIGILESRIVQLEKSLSGRRRANAKLTDLVKKQKKQLAAGVEIVPLLMDAMDEYYRMHVEGKALEKNADAWLKENKHE